MVDKKNSYVFLFEHPMGGVDCPFKTGAESWRPRVFRKVIEVDQGVTYPDLLVRLDQDKPVCNNCGAELILIRE